MVTSTHTRPLGGRVTAAPSRPPVELSAGHASASGALLFLVLILLGAVLALATMIRNLLATVAAVLGQTVRLFGMLLLALVAVLVLLVGMVSRAANGDAPSHTPTHTLKP